MDLTGKLKSPEFTECSLPLTMIVEGKKISLGFAYVDASGFVSSTVNVYDNPHADKINELFRSRTNMQFSIKLNPEVRLETKPASFPE